MNNETLRKKLATRLSKYRYVLLVILLGVVLLSFQDGCTEKSTESVEQAAEQSFDISETEARLEAILCKTEGVGEVKVMLTLKNDGERQLAQDEDETLTDGKNDRKTETVIVSSSGSEAPYIVKQSMPEYLGAVVVCSGGGNAAVKMTVTSVVSALTGLGSNRIQVVKMT